MDNALHFGPLWSLPPMIKRPNLEIENIRLQVLQWALTTSPPATNTQSDDMFPIFMDALRALFDDPKELDNSVLHYLRAQGDLHSGGPVGFIESMLHLWYVSAIPVLARDCNQGTDITSAALNENGQIAQDLDPGSSEAKLLFANLGILAMLLTSKNWKAPADANFHAATLTANTVASMVYAAYTIGIVQRNTDWKFRTGKISFRLTLKTFVKCAWQLSRQGGTSVDRGPGCLFGAKSNEIKLAPDGKGILIPIDEEAEEWNEPPYWHPFKQVPGSAWNKFLKNKQQPIFSVNDTDATGITHRMPSSAMNMISSFQVYYRQIRARMDDEQRPRPIIRGKNRRKQYNDLASHSGMWYPSNKINHDVSDEAYNVIQEYQYNVPTCKKPATDLKGHATLPFLSSAIRAMRFEEEPEEIDETLFMMLFGGQEAGDFF